MRKYAERQDVREQRAREGPGRDEGLEGFKGSGKMAREYRGPTGPHQGPPFLSDRELREVPREFRDSKAPSLEQGMSTEERFRIADQFHLGLREHNPLVEARRPNLGQAFLDGDEATDLDIAIYLANPSRGDSRTTYEDVARGRYFQMLRARFNSVDDLRGGLAYLNLAPSSPQRLHLIVDQFNGKDPSETSGIIVRKIGCTSFGCGFRNEIEWLPRVLTANGLFGIGTYAVVASKLQYRYLAEENGVGEAVFIGDMWPTLASRDLAKVYIEALRVA